MEAKKPTTDYDVIILGGALAGASAAVLLLRDQPDLRILILEKSRSFERRVGEATVEISAYFLSRVLGLTQHLNQKHLVKQGFRFWFANDCVKNLGQSSELGARYLARVPAFQIDRPVLDEEILQRAVGQGAALRRPVSVQSVTLQEGGRQTVTYRDGDEVQTQTARWVVDASGVAALLARQQGWWQSNDAHPVSSVWARWRGVADLDGLDVVHRYPELARNNFGIRATATNHVMGQGWWAWMIPLKGGDVSVGVVYDERLVDWPTEGSLGQRLKDFLGQHPVARELLQDAKWVEGDVHKRRHLAYRVNRFAGDGFVLVGDAAGFLDPFYSPGMDWVAFTVSAAAALMGSEAEGNARTAQVERYNRDFSRAYSRWFDAIYRDKYHYLGDFQLMRWAFLLDLGFYYLGVVSQPFKRGPKALEEPVFSSPPSTPVYWIMRCYNRRFAAMGIHRRKRGTWGQRNHGRRFLFGGYAFNSSSTLPLFQALLAWGWLELTEGWRTWLPLRSVTDRKVPSSIVKPVGDSALTN